jgi:hypothetical protein
LAVTPGLTQAALSVSTDEAGGRLHWMVDASATRSAEEIVAGGGVASGARPVEAAGLQAPIGATGLSPATGYRFHVLHVDAAGNRSAPVSAAFVTASPASGGIRVEQSAVTVSSSGGPGYAGSGFVVGAAANRALVALVHGYSASAGTVPADVAISFGGVAMTPVLAPSGFAQSRAWIAAYMLVNPPPGGGAVSLNWTLSTRACAVTLVEVSGVNQAAPVVASGSADSGVGVVTSQAFTRADGDIVLSAIGLGSGGRGVEIGSAATLLQSGQTGVLGTSDVSFGVAHAPGGHGYTWTTADRAVVGWLELRRA